MYSLCYSLFYSLFVLQGELGSVSPNRPRDLLFMSIITRRKIYLSKYRADNEKKQKVIAKTITDADYADDIEILANTPNQTETLLHSFERATAGIGLYVIAHKTEYMCLNQTGDISTLERASLKLVDKFTYLGSSLSSNIVPDSCPCLR